MKKQPFTSFNFKTDKLHPGDDLVNLSGKVISSGNVIAVPNGIYFIRRATGDGNVMLHKVVKF